MGNKRGYIQNPKLESTEPLAKKSCTKMDQPLSVGMSGVFFTTTTGKKASQCAEEAILLVKEYLVNRIKPSESTLFEKADAAQTSESMKRCVEELSREHTNEQQLFCVTTGVKNTLFIVIRNADPVDLVMRILNDVKAGGRKPSHLLQRLLPCQISCAAAVKHIAKAIGELLKSKFTQELVEQKPSFAVVFQHRNNASISSQEIYDVVVTEIRTLSPESKVCLRSPKLYILVNIVKTVCCLSVLESYNELKQFNWVNI
ncbi:THUMP domain containing protein [Trichuris trichiura]|uniref:THUMP domain containing protein n=1 Tax=Trichuris trichiura TaxID=36087 RepID=A0A077ZF07_TRITR|nr:THUMP domain containing protein [Trichuris trichiura]